MWKAAKFGHPNLTTPWQNLAPSDEVCILMQNIETSFKRHLNALHCYAVVMGNSVYKNFCMFHLLEISRHCKGGIRYSHNFVDYVILRNLCNVCRWPSNEQHRQDSTDPGACHRQDGPVMHSTAKIALTQGLLALWTGALLALAIILVSKQCYNRKNPSRSHLKDGSVMNSTAKIALTKRCLALWS